MSKFDKAIEDIRDGECNGYQCRHETGENHYLVGEGGLTALTLAHNAELAEAVARATRDSALAELKYLDEIFAEYDSKREVWSVIQSHIRNRKAQLTQPPQPTGQEGGGRG